MRTTSPFDTRAFENLESPFLNEEIVFRPEERELDSAETEAEVDGGETVNEEVQPGADEWSDSREDFASPEWQFTEEEIIGKDNRTRVTDTLKVPYRWICAIDVMSENPDWGKQGEPRLVCKSRATGALIGTRYVLTARHVFGTDSKKLAQLASEHTVSPARNGDNTRSPFGRIKTKAVFVAQPYRTFRSMTNQGRVVQIPVNNRDDYALIILDQDVSSATTGKAKTKLGFWGEDSNVAVVKRLDPTVLDKQDIIVSGYPGDTCGSSKWSGSKSQKTRKIEDCWRRRNDEWASTQWECGGTLTASAGTNLVYHTADTYEGQSGAPIFLERQKVLNLVAVHSGSDTATRNVGVPVTLRMLQELCGWINADAGYTAAVVQNDTLTYQPPAARSSGKQAGAQQEAEEYEGLSDDWWHTTPRAVRGAVAAAREEEFETLGESPDESESTEESFDEPASEASLAEARDETDDTDLETDADFEVRVRPSIEEPAEHEGEQVGTGVSSTHGEDDGR